VGLYDNAKPPYFDTRHLYNPAALAPPQEDDQSSGRSWRSWFTFGLIK